MIIGTFNEQSGSYTGDILGFALRVSGLTFRAVKAKGNGPDFIVTAEENGKTFEIGAAWQKTSVASGKPYLSVKLDGPTLPMALNCALIRQQDGSHGLVWHRREDPTVSDAA